MPHLILADASLAYGHVPLLDHADFQLEPGERVALIGRNGCGKSSLLRALAGQGALDDGTVWRWYVDGGTYENDENNQGTGVVRFDNVLKSGQNQVLFSKTEGNTNLVFDFSQLTQANTSTSVTGVADGSGNEVALVANG